MHEVTVKGLWRPRSSGFWMLKLAEECGEVIKAFNRRYSGLSHRRGPLEDVSRELADAVMCCFIVADKLGINLDLTATVGFEHIMTRGFVYADDSQAGSTTARTPDIPPVQGEPDQR